MRPALIAAAVLLLAGGRFLFAMLVPDRPGRVLSPDEQQVHRLYPRSGMYEGVPGRLPVLRWKVDWYSDTVLPSTDGGPSSG